MFDIYIYCIYKRYIRISKNAQLNLGLNWMVDSFNEGKTKQHGYGIWTGHHDL